MRAFEPLPQEINEYLVNYICEYVPFVLHWWEVDTVFFIVVHNEDEDLLFIRIWKELTNEYEYHLNWSLDNIIYDVLI